MSVSLARVKYFSLGTSIIEVIIYIKLLVKLFTKNDFDLAVKPSEEINENNCINL